MSFSNIFETIRNEHVMLLYDTDDQRKKFTINCINKGLERGGLCIYLSIDTENTESSFKLSNITSKILNYREHIREGNLQILNIKPYYESAKHEDLSLHRKLIEVIEETLIRANTAGKSISIFVIGGTACLLLHNKYFHECIEFEKLVHDSHSRFMKNSYSITLICPYSKSPVSIIKGNELINITDNLANLHTMTIDLN